MIHTLPAPLDYSEALAILQEFFYSNVERDPYINELEFMADDVVYYGCKSEADVYAYLRDIANAY